MTTLMRRSNLLGAKSLAFTLVAVTLTLGSARFLHSQESAESHRKVISRVAPEYPGTARMLNLRGSVKLDALVEPNGTVKTAEVKGGHPLLAQAALNAVYKWRWEPAAKDSHELVVVQFNPQ